MIDLDILKDCGISAETLKKTFSLKAQADAKAEWSDRLENGEEPQRKKVGRLLKRIDSRIRQGRDYGIQNYRVYEAIDNSWNSPLNQVTPSMLWSLTDKDVSADAAMDKLKSWGIRAEDYIREIPDPKTPGKTQKVVEIPAFIQPRVSLAKNYTEIRWATLVNDRKSVPFFKYEPAISNQLTQMRCEIITSRVEEMSNQYNYKELDKQMRLRVLKYGTQLSFPSEAWSWECQLAEPGNGHAGVPKDDGAERTEYENASDMDGTEVSGDGTYTETDNASELSPGPDKPVKVKNYVETVTKEGINYHLPHPARTYRDQAHWAATFNSDSGARYAGYWKVMRFGELRGCRHYWNLDKIRISTGTDWYTPGRGIFENVYSCALKFPSMSSASGGVGEKDGEKIVGDGFYTSTMEDEGILVHNYFEKLNPKENGIGDYDYDLWFRFVVAGDGTVIYCEALPYCPVGYAGYDADESNVVQSSMMLEIIPWETQLTNLFSQYIISVIQNCYNITLVDEDVVDQATISSMRRAPSVTFLGFNILPFSGKKFEKSLTSPRALYTERFAQLNTSEIAQAMKTCLELVERLLVMSPQEMGQAASHEQTKEEVKTVSASSSSRLEFTGSAMDPWTDAIKRQIYAGLMAYGEDEFYAQVPSDPEIQGEEGKKALEALGFTFEGMDSETGRVTVGAKLSKMKEMSSGKTAIPYDKFVSNRDAKDRVNEREQAQQQMAFIDRVLSNPMLMQATGPDQGISMMNSVARGLGFPRDFKLVNKMNDQTMLQQNNDQVMQQVQQLIQQFGQQMEGQIKSIVDLVAKKNQEQDEQIKALTGGQLGPMGGGPPPMNGLPPGETGMNEMPEMQGMPATGMDSAMMPQ